MKPPNYLQNCPEERPKLPTAVLQLPASGLQVASAGCAKRKEFLCICIHLIYTNFLTKWRGTFGYAHSLIVCLLAPKHRSHWSGNLQDCFKSAPGAFGTVPGALLELSERQEHFESPQNRGAQAPSGRLVSESNLRNGCS